MPYTITIEIIGWLIEEENIWFLDEGSREEEASLLST
jgi:hypothetical protein